MRLYKKILLTIVIVFIAIQFIKPAFNTSGQILSTDITKTVNIPNKVLDILKNSCYDCHSNNTRYPWYVNIQPLGWIMARHIKKGKQNLNFSQFGTYSKRKQADKLKSIAESLKDNTMPLSSYAIMHTDAKLSTTDKNLITDWASNAKDSLQKKENY